LKLIVDTNILLGALIKNSTTRSILLNPNHAFYLPEFAKEEVAKHFLSIECNGIWSIDRDLKEQKLIRVWSTIELMKILDRA